MCTKLHYDNIIVSMIKDKYKTIEIIKAKDGKVIERVGCTASSKTLVLKSYPLEDAKSIKN